MKYNLSKPERLLWLAVVALVFILVGSAFNGPAERVDNTAESAFEISESPIFAPTLTYANGLTTLDTITDTGKDTITLATRLYSKWAYAYMLKGDQLTGTIDLTIDIDESNTDSGDDWIQVGTAQLTTDGGTVRVTGATVFGKRQRIRVDGAGTQSSSYTIYPVFKKE